MPHRQDHGISGDDETVSLITPPPSPVIGSGGHRLARERDGYDRDEQRLPAEPVRLERRATLLVIAEERTIGGALGQALRGGGLGAYEVTIASDAATAMRLLRERDWQAYVLDEPSFALLSWLGEAERARIERRAVVVTELEAPGPIALSSAAILPAARVTRFSLDNALWQVLRHQLARSSQAPAGDSLYDVLLRLARTDLGRERDLGLALRPLVESACRALRLGRASVWQLLESPKRLRLLALYDARLGEHQAGMELPAAVCPVYCMSLHNHRIMAIEDAARDTRAAELGDYLAANGVGALLDAPLYLDGAVAGVLCCAHSGGPRRWSEAESHAAAAFADYAQLVLMAHRRRVAEEQLAARAAEMAQARKLDALGRMAGGVAHEFGNLLTVIAGRAEMIERGLASGAGGSAERVDDARAVLAACERATSLVRQLQTLARTAPPERARVELEPLIDEVLATLARTVDPRIAVTRERAPSSRPLPAIPGDADELRRALLDLGLRTRDVLPDGGAIVYAAGMTRDERGRDWIEIAVGPDGAAAAGEQRDADPEAGLAVAGACADAHGGTLRLARAAGGMVARLRLPLAPRAPASGGCRGRRVLVIDDDAEVRRAIAGMLEFFGCAVVEAAGAYDGIRVFGERRREIDLVLLDLVMPDMAGRDCFRALRLIDRGLRCLLISGQASDETLGDCLAAGALGLVRKPFAMATLIQEVERALASATDASAPV